MYIYNGYWYVVFSSYNTFSGFDVRVILSLRNELGCIISFSFLGDLEVLMLFLL